MQPNSHLPPTHKTTSQPTKNTIYILTVGRSWPNPDFPVTHILTTNHLLWVLFFNAGLWCIKPYKRDQFKAKELQSPFQHSSTPGPDSHFLCTNAKQMKNAIKSVVFYRLFHVRGRQRAQLRMQHQCSTAQGEMILQTPCKSMIAQTLHSTLGEFVVQWATLH